MRTACLTLLTYLRSALIILLFLGLGKGITALSGLPIPGSIIGLLLLFTALTLRVVNYQTLLPTANLLLRYMTLFFVPVGVGLLQYGDLLSQYWLAIGLSSVIGTFTVLLTTGWVYQRLAK